MQKRASWDDAVGKDGPADLDFPAATAPTGTSIASIFSSRPACCCDAGRLRDRVVASGLPAHGTSQEPTPLRSSAWIPGVSEQVNVGGPTPQAASLRPHVPPVPRSKRTPATKPIDRLQSRRRRRQSAGSRRSMALLLASASTEPGSLLSEVFCGVGPPTLTCSETPGIQALDLSGVGYWDVPCAGEPPRWSPTNPHPEADRRRSGRVWARAEDRRDRRARRRGRPPGSRDICRTVLADGIVDVGVLLDRRPDAGRVPARSRPRPDGAPVNGPGSSAVRQHLSARQVQVRRRSASCSSSTLPRADRTR